MNKISGKYYLQYSAPGTEFKTYADGVYVADKPAGPFTYALYSPFSFKPTGFICGAGHSCTFADKTLATGTLRQWSSPCAIPLSEDWAFSQFRRCRMDN